MGASHGSITWRAAGRASCRRAKESTLSNPAAFTISLASSGVLPIRSGTVALGVAPPPGALSVPLLVLELHGYLTFAPSTIEGSSAVLLGQIATTSAPSSPWPCTEENITPFLSSAANSFLILNAPQVAS